MIHSGTELFLAAATGAGEELGLAMLCSCVVSLLVVRSVAVATSRTIDPAALARGNTCWEVDGPNFVMKGFQKVE